MRHDCPKCGSETDCLPGEPAHQNNWFCTDVKGCGWQAWTERKESPSDPGGSKVDLEYALDQEKEKTARYERMVWRMRGALQELYAARGEDELVARVCSQLIDESRDY